MMRQQQKGQKQTKAEEINIKGKEKKVGRIGRQREDKGNSQVKIASCEQFMLNI